MVTDDPTRVVRPDGHAVVHADLVGVIGSYLGRRVVADRVGHVLRGVEEDLLAALAVLEAHLVRRPGCGGRRCLPRRARLVGGERIRNLELAVVEVLHHERPVGVAVVVLGDDLPPAPRQDHRLSHPELPASHVGRGLVVALTHPVPEELHPDAAERVGVGLLPRGTAHHARLGARHDPRGAARARAREGRRGDRFPLGDEPLVRAPAPIPSWLRHRAGGRDPLPGRELETHHEELRVDRVDRVAAHLELVSDA